jgi:hypothetical protein
MDVSFFVSMDYAPVHISPCSADRRAQNPGFMTAPDKDMDTASRKIGRSSSAEASKKRIKRPEEAGAMQVDQ